MKLLRGIELGQPLQDLNAAHDALTGRDYDVVIGSLHNIRDHDDFYHIGEHNPTEQEIDNALHAYFAESLEMVEWGKFDTLAHITYPLRYMCKAGETPSYKPYQDELDAVLKALIKSDIALEFNTSRILRTDAPKLPDREVYSRYKELGGKLVTIGADAHRTENIASGVEEAMELLSDIGYQGVHRVCRAQAGAGANRIKQITLPAAKGTAGLQNKNRRDKTPWIRKWKSF